MKKLIILLLLITSCVPFIYNYKSATYNIRHAFPNGVIYEDVNNPTYYFVFDTVTHNAYIIPITSKGNGVGEITMMTILCNEDYTKEIKK